LTTLQNEPQYCARHIIGHSRGYLSFQITRSHYHYIVGIGRVFIKYDMLIISSNIWK